MQSPPPAGTGATFRLADFSVLTDDEVRLRLLHWAASSGLHDNLKPQNDAWTRELAILRTAAAELARRIPNANHWTLILEFEIPRTGRRVDAVLLADDLVFVLEFKVGEEAYPAPARRQVEDYALDLADFHEASHDRPIVPILICTNAPAQPSAFSQTPAVPVQPLYLANSANLADVIVAAHSALHAPSRPAIDADTWLTSPYRPTPNIIQAAQALFAGHSVRDIARAEASTKNLTLTQSAVERAVAEARDTNSKVICFITGVPGAGKTLAGLNAAHALSDVNGQAIFLSGNGPLVKVLQEALAIDQCKRTKAARHDARRRARTLVQNVHRFLGNYLTRDTTRPPDVRVALFDEAQRAWDFDQSKRKFDRPESEPASMLRVMDRHPDWAAIIALVGGGQEINTGEAGLAEWGRALAANFPHWRVRLASQLLTGDASTVGQTLFRDGIPPNLTVHTDEDLHLHVPTRTYRSTTVCDWVNALLNLDRDAALAARARMSDFPILLTRSFDTARRHLAAQTRGSRRCGLVAASSARRLRPHGIDVRSEIEEAHYFLAPPEDVRSSNYRELAATEFHIQGLELDRTCLCWDADLRPSATGWQSHRFQGTAWRKVRDPRTHQYTLNKYRVLLTRARESQIIWVPPGDPEDPTRPPRTYDAIAETLLRFGAEMLDG